MQSRSDSVLNTGLNSATVSKVERSRLAREQRALEKESKRSRLTPAAEVVIEEIEKERDTTTMQLLDSIDGGMTDDQFKSQVQALQLYRESMNHLKSRISNILRERNDRTTDQGE